MFSFTYNEMTTKIPKFSGIGIYIENIHKITKSDFDQIFADIWNRFPI